MELNYDDMLNKMHLKYLNGNFYKTEPKPEPRPEPEPLKKEEYIKLVNLHRMKRLEIKRQQIEKRKLLISAANGSYIKINAAPNNFFKLKL